MDGFDIPALQALSPTGTFDKIFIDIGGIAELHVVMGLLGLYYRTFKTAYIIVKSKFLTHLMGQAQVWVPPGHQKKDEELQQAPWRPRLKPAAAAVLHKQQQEKGKSVQVEGEQRKQEQEVQNPVDKEAHAEQQEQPNHQGCQDMQGKQQQQEKGKSVQVEGEQRKQEHEVQNPVHK
jgi:Mg-chelatase subunit ChlI